MAAGMEAGLRAIGERAVRRACARIAERAELPPDVTATAVDGGVAIEGRAIRRRLAYDMRLRAAGWLAGRTG